jgi:putative ABC transport system ATP-binding protein
MPGFFTGSAHHRPPFPTGAVSSNIDSERKTMIRFESVSYTGGNVSLFWGLTFHLPRGGYMVISGPPRWGKTALVQLTAGVVSPEQGEIHVGDVSLRAAIRVAKKLRSVRLDIGGVGGIYSLISERTVMENIALAGELAGIPRRTARKSALELCGKYRLNHVARQYPRMISDVERRAAQIARAEAGRRRLIVADAPADGLDEVAAGFINDRLAALHLAGVTILYLTSGAGPQSGPTQRLRLVNGGVTV